MTSAADIHRWLMVSGQERNVCDAFDAHILAAALATALEAAQAGTTLTQSLGWTGAEITEVVGSVFPHASELIQRAPQGEDPEVVEEEAMLSELLFRGSTERTPLEQLLARLIARRALLAHHLWQDLGLRHRRELSWLMTRHFEPLATRNAKDMKWKKFLYRAICRDTGFSLCAAPCCEECDDYDDCFGDEEGESLLASNESRSGAMTL